MTLLVTVLHKTDLCCSIDSLGFKPSGQNKHIFIDEFTEYTDEVV